MWWDHCCHDVRLDLETLVWSCWVSKVITYRWSMETSGVLGLFHLVQGPLHTVGFKTFILYDVYLKWPMHCHQLTLLSLSGSASYTPRLSCVTSEWEDGRRDMSLKKKEAGRETFHPCNFLALPLIDWSVMFVLGQPQQLGGPGTSNKVSEKVEKSGVQLMGVLFLPKKSGIKINQQINQSETVRS